MVGTLLCAWFCGTGSSSVYARAAPSASLIGHLEGVWSIAFSILKYCLKSKMAARPIRSFSGLAKGASLPAPTGHHTVGCVDLMHKLEGVSDGLLMRLFYPAVAGKHTGSVQRAKWMPHAMYTRTTLDFIKFMVPGLSSNAMERFTSKQPYVCILNRGVGGNLEIFLEKGGQMAPFAPPPATPLFHNLQQ